MVFMCVCVLFMWFQVQGEVWTMAVLNRLNFWDLKHKSTGEAGQNVWVTAQRKEQDLGKRAFH